MDMVALTSAEALTLLTDYEQPLTKEQRKQIATCVARMDWLIMFPPGWEQTIGVTD